MFFLLLDDTKVFSIAEESAISNKHKSFSFPPVAIRSWEEFSQTLTHSIGFVNLVSATFSDELSRAPSFMGTE